MEEMLRDVVKEQRKTNFRQYVIVIILIASLVVTNGYWIWQNGQWEYSTITEIGTTGENGTAIINSGEGDVRNGNGKESSENKD